MDTQIRRQPPYNGQTACPLPLTVHTFLPRTKGQPPNNGQNVCPQRVHYSEVPLYYMYEDYIMYVRIQMRYSMITMSQKYMKYDSIIELSRQEADKIV